MSGSERETIITAKECTIKYVQCFNSELIFLFVSVDYVPVFVGCISCNKGVISFGGSFTTNSKGRSRGLLAWLSTRTSRGAACPSGSVKGTSSSPLGAFTREKYRGRTFSFMGTGSRFHSSSPSSAAVGSKMGGEYLSAVSSRVLGILHGTQATATTALAAAATTTTTTLFSGETVITCDSFVTNSPLSRSN